MVHLAVDVQSPWHSGVRHQRRMGQGGERGAQCRAHDIRLELRSADQVSGAVVLPVDNTHRDHIEVILGNLSAVRRLDLGARIVRDVVVKSRDGLRAVRETKAQAAIIGKPVIGRWRVAQQGNRHLHTRVRGVVSSVGLPALLHAAQIRGGLRADTGGKDGENGGESQDQHQTESLLPQLGSGCVFRHRFSLHSRLTRITTGPKSPIGKFQIRSKDYRLS